MVVWNSMLPKIIIILLGVVKQHVRFILHCLITSSKIFNLLNDSQIELRQVCFCKYPGYHQSSTQSAGIVNFRY